MLSKYFILFLLSVFSFSSFSVAKDYWGAIAVNELTGVAGGDMNSASEKEASDSALDSCRKKNRRAKCRLIATFVNSCNATAYSPRNKSSRSGWDADDLAKAKKNALLRCKSIEKDPTCVLNMGFCTAWETVEYIWW